MFARSPRAKILGDGSCCCPRSRPVDTGGELLRILEAAQRRGLLGPAPVEQHVAHAHAFVAAAGKPPDRFLDLGSGGGVPGLVLLTAWPETSAVLLDGQLRRVRFLTDAVARLAPDNRVEILHARAEDAGHDDRWRGRFDLVTARSFARPAVTAECGAPFLRAGGCLLVAEPPDSRPERWPDAGLALLGLRDEGRAGTPGAGVRRLVAEQLCPARFPRRPGVPGKRPLFV